jgi:PAS domain S-box-containing protein
MNTSLAARPESLTEERFQLLVEAVTDYGIFMLDPEGHIISWNLGAQRLKGWRREEVLGKHFSIFYPKEATDSGWPQEELRLATQKGRFEDEGWRIRKDGTRFWANVIITALFAPSGELTGFAKITRDLTERRRHEEALRVSEERFRLLVDSVRDYAIFMLDPDGIVESWNSGATAILGYQPDEIIGRHFRAFFSPEDQQAGKPEQELLAAREHGHVEDEGWRVRHDGNLFWADVVLTAIHGPEGDLRGFAKVTRDMSERRRLEELERSSRRMNEFLAMLAHELRNPLAPIRNAVTIMQLEALASPVLRNCRDVIDRQLTHVTRLVDDLLDVGRLTTGKIKLRRELLRLSEVVTRSVEVARPLISARHHTLSVEQPNEPVYVQGDSTRLSQVLQNLLVNAAKYTPDGGRIQLKVTPRDGLVYVTVTDNGRGIAAEHLKSIFQLFVQAETGTASGTESGLGIGLTLARSLAEMHGGTIEATSPGLGLGSTFTVRLPVAPQAEVEESEQSRDDPAGGLRVLVIDDNRDSADSATDVLRLLGNQVESAYDGERGVAAARRLKPHMILVDLAMPGMDGFEVRQQLGEDGDAAGAFLVAMTGFGNEEDKKRTRAAGFDAHLTKPVELEALVSLLSEARTRAGLPRAAPPA